MKTILQRFAHWLGPFLAGAVTAVVFVTTIFAITGAIAPPLLWAFHIWWKWWLG